MKTDFYTKVLLTIIALCLTFNVLKDIRIIPDVYAGSSQVASSLTAFPAASLLKANEDGSLNVRLLASEIIKVEPTSSARFTVTPYSSAEFKVKPVSSSTKFTVENDSYNPLYVTPHRNAVFNVKQTGGSTYSEEIAGGESTYAYPSPAAGKVTIVYNASSFGEYLTICSIDGKVTDHLQLDPAQNELLVDISRYIPGTYIYNFNGNGGKFIVKNR